MTEQRTRLQAITAKLAHICDHSKALRGELAGNDTIIKALLEERSQLSSGASKSSTNITNTEEKDND